MKKGYIVLRTNNACVRTMCNLCRASMETIVPMTLVYVDELPDPCSHYQGEFLDVCWNCAKAPPQGIKAAPVDDLAEMVRNGEALIAGDVEAMRRFWDSGITIVNFECEAGTA